MENKLPLGWESDELDSLIAFVIGGDWGKDPEKISEEDYSLVACIRGSEIKKWSSEKGQSASIRAIKTNSLEKRKLEEGDIILEISGGGPDQPVGRVVFIDKEVFTHNSEYPKVPTNFLRLIRPNKEIHSKYLFSYLEFFYYSGEVVNYQGGSNNLRNLKFKEYSKISIPLPPLPEQKRIAAKLDEIFGHLDELKSKLDGIPALLKNFRQQVLTQAVTGKLTEEWRKGRKLGEVQELLEELKNQKVQLHKNKLIRKERELSPIKEDQKLMDIPIVWQYVKLGHLASFINGDRGKNYPNRSEYVDDTGVAFINTGHIEPNGNLDLNSMNYISEEKYDSLGSGKINFGDLVYCLRGATLGKTAVVSQFEKGAIASSLVIIRPLKGINNWFLYYFLQSSIGRSNIRLYDNGSAQPNLSAESVRNYVLGLPCIEEQDKIVDRVRDLFLLADKIEAQYSSLKIKIDTLPQAILNKAFKGELVPQNPNDEPASVLLERIKGIKTGSKKAAKAYKAPQGEIPMAAEPK